MTNLERFTLCYETGYKFAKMGGIEQNVKYYLADVLGHQPEPFELRAAYGGHEDYLAEDAFPKMSKV